MIESAQNGPASIHPRRRRKLVITAAIASMLIVVVAIYLRDDPLADLPTIDIADVDGNVAAAIAAARQRILEEPRSAPAWGNLGMLLFAHEFDAEAVVCFARAERLDSNEYRWPYLQGLCLRNVGTSQGIDAFQRASELRPNLSFLRLSLGEQLILLGRLDEAEAEFAAVIRVDADNAQAQLRLGRIALLRGELNDSLRWLTLSASNDSQNRQTHELLAQVHHRMGKSAAATREFEIAKSLLIEALDDPVMKAVIFMRRDPEFISYRAKKLKLNGRIGEAISMQQYLVEQNPGVPRYYAELAESLQNVGETNRATLVLENGIKRCPSSSKLRLLRGDLHYNRRHWKAAAERFHEAIELKPNNAQAHYGLGHCLTKLNDHPGAVSAFRRAVQIQPEFALAHVFLGKRLLEAGKNSQAAAHLRIATHLTPDNSQAQKLLQQALSPSENNSCETSTYELSEMFVLGDAAIENDAIDERTTSKISLMPEDLLNTLTTKTFSIFSPTSKTAAMPTRERFGRRYHLDVLET